MDRSLTGHRKGRVNEDNEDSMAATAVCLALSGVVSVAQEKIPELQRDGAAGAKTPTLSGCVARGASTGTYTLTSHVKNTLRRPPPTNRGPSP